MLYIIAERNKCQWFKLTKKQLMKTAPAKNPVPIPPTLFTCGRRAWSRARAWMNGHRNVWCPKRPPAWKTNTWCSTCNTNLSITTNLKRHLPTCPGLKAMESSKKRKKCPEGEDWRKGRKKKRINWRQFYRSTSRDLKTISCQHLFYLRWGRPRMIRETQRVGGRWDKDSKYNPSLSLRIGQVLERKSPFSLDPIRHLLFFF